MKDIIGKLPIPHAKDESGTIRFTVDPTASEVELRAEFALADREVKAIRDEYDGDYPADILDRFKLLQEYKKAIREVVVARAEALAVISEDVTLPEPVEAKPVAKAEVKPEPDPEPTAPAPAAKPQAKDDDEDPDRAPAKPEFVIDGDTVIDKDGNRYSLISEEPIADQARRVDAKELEVINASLKPSPRNALLASIASDEKINEDMAAEAPLLAGMGSLAGGQMKAGDEITAATAGHQIFQAAQQRANARTYLFRRDRFQPLQASLGLERLGGSASSPGLDRAVAEAQAAHSAALLAAFCGPGELNRQQNVAVNSARPVATAIAQASGPVAIGLGIHEFFRALSLADLHQHYDDNPSAPSGIGQWNAADQAAVDTADPATWKHCFTLPDCPTTVQVSAYFLWRCLRVTIEDQMSRPQYVQNITTLMEAMLARSAETALLATIDAWSFNRTVPNTPGMGVMAQVFWAIEHVMAWATAGLRIDRSAYSLIIPEFLLNAARIDAFFAGEDMNAVGDKMMEAAGGRLVVTPDWGTEGNPMAPIGLQPTPDAADAADGTDIPLLPSTAVIRLVPLEDFVWGQTGVVDYGIETSPDLRRQNAALYFGEMAEIAYKNGGRPSFTLTLEDIVPNGARAKNFMDTSGLFADSNTAYNNSLPDFMKAGLPEAQFSSVVETEIS